MDALSESDQVSIGIESRQKVEERMRQLEGRADVSGAPKQGGARPKPVDVYTAPAVPKPGFNPAGDSTLGAGPAADADAEKAAKKAAKKAKKEAEAAEADGAVKKKKKKDRDADGDEAAEKKKAKKAKKAAD